MVTIKQVAQEAGVSKSTVSRYISQNGYVGKEAQEKIEKAIEKLKFVPNLSARSLKTKRNQLVGLLLPDISNPFFPMLAKGVEEFLQERGYRVMLGNIGEDEALEEDYLRVLAQTNAAGVITTHDFSEKFSDIDIPVVIVDREGHKSNYGVFSNNVAGGKLAAKIVVEAGGTNIAVVSGPLTAVNINNRFKASVDFLDNIDTNYKKFYSKSYNFEVIQEEANNLLDCFQEVDTIIAPSDVHAIAFIHEILARGKKIPEDIQIIGYDDILISQFVYPALSTIHQSAYTMGEEAARLVYEIDNEQYIEKKRIELPIHYVERETIRKNRK
ncbi:MAG TPA: LacI family DNA-binding transcriptional regulator [Lactovum miscens]|uniref:LacI family DNA-binding transcriptional regulator n=1 Tax=Lactovum miscens TaxID=190387 RepID=UPI002ED81522